MLFDRRTWIISVFMCCHVMAIINGELEVLGHCLKAPASPGFLSCFGQEAITRLQMIDDSSNYTIANGLVMIRSESQASRSLPSFQEQDPMDFRFVQCYSFSNRIINLNEFIHSHSYS